MNEEIGKLKDEVKFLRFAGGLCIIGVVAILILSCLILDRDITALDNKMEHRYMNIEQIQTLLKFNTKIINDTVQNDLLLIDAVLYNQERLTVIEEMLYIELE